MIHSYKLGGHNIVLDVCSGSVHIVDDVAYDIINAYENTPHDKIISDILSKYSGREDVSEADILDCFSDIESLKKSGRLFTPDTFEPIAGKLKKKTSGVVKALCLHVAHICNLNYSYCFASQGKYNGERAVMPLEVGKRALDFLIENSGTRRNLEVDFFGGEPLMNFDVVKELVKYARGREKETGKNFRFTLTTNGMLIDDDVIDFANRECSNVVLSLDGRREVHDRYRVDYAGNGSWERIVPKFQKLVEARGGKNYYMRGTFTHANPDFLNDIKEMLSLGFRELSMEPVVTSPDDPSALTEEDLPTVLRQYEELCFMGIISFVQLRLGFFNPIASPKAASAAEKNCGNRMSISAQTGSGRIAAIEAMLQRSMGIFVIRSWTLSFARSTGRISSGSDCSIHKVFPSRETEGAAVAFIEERVHIMAAITTAAPPVPNASDSISLRIAPFINTNTATQRINTVPMAQLSIYPGLCVRRPNSFESSAVPRLFCEPEAARMRPFELFFDVPPSEAVAVDINVFDII